MKSRTKLAVGLVLSAATFTGVALASHDLGLVTTVSPTTINSPVGTKVHIESGTAIPKSGAVHFQAGVKLAHANDLTSPVSPPPVNGDSVGSLQLYGDLISDGCGNPATYPVAVTWVEPIGSGAPAGTVAELKLTSTPIPFLTITKRAFIVQSSGDAWVAGSHYNLVLPDFPDEYACGGSTSKYDMETFAFAKAGGVATSRIVAKNPSTAGTYNIFFEYLDINNAQHQDVATVTIK